jgi:hypothetical protein
MRRLDEIERGDFRLTVLLAVADGQPSQRVTANTYGGGIRATWSSAYSAVRSHCRDHTVQIIRTLERV